MITPVRRIAAIVLAAGESSRMGEPKLLIDLNGKAMIERVADTLLASRCAPIIVVVGSEEAAIRALLGNRNIRIVSNAEAALGMSRSLYFGLAALAGDFGDDIEAAVICLGDMPDVDTPLIDQLVAAFDPGAEHEIVVPVRGGREGNTGRRGNPVLWGRRFFPALKAITGDRGGRDLIAANRRYVVNVQIDDERILVDLDTPSEVAAWRRQHGQN